MTIDQSLKYNLTFLGCTIKKLQPEDFKAIGYTKAFALNEQTLAV